MLRTASGLPSGGLVQALMKTSSAAQMISEKVNRPPSGPTAQKPQGSSSPLFLSPSPQHRFGRCRPRPPQREPEVPPPPPPSVCRALRTRQQSTINIISGSGGTHWKVLAPGHFSAMPSKLPWAFLLVIPCPYFVFSGPLASPLHLGLSDADGETA